MSEKVMPVWDQINDRLSSFVLSKVKDPDLTKDIVQDVFLKVFSKSDALRNQDKLVSWIYQITRNEIVSHFRKLQFYEDKLDVVEENESEFTSDLAKCVRPFIETLPEKYKEALILSDLDKIPQKELAERLNVTYSGLKSRVQRARKMLAITYNECCTISKDKYGNVMDYSPNSSDNSCTNDCD